MLGKVAKLKIGGIGALCRMNGGVKQQLLELGVFCNNASSFQVGHGRQIAAQQAFLKDER